MLLSFLLKCVEMSVLFGLLLLMQLCLMPLILLQRLVIPPHCRSRVELRIRLAPIMLDIELEIILPIDGAALESESH